MIVDGNEGTSLEEEMGWKLVASWYDTHNAARPVKSQSICTPLLLQYRSYTESGTNTSGRPKPEDSDYSHRSFTEYRYRLTSRLSQTSLALICLLEDRVIERVPKLCMHTFRSAQRRDTHQAGFATDTSSARKSDTHDYAAGRQCSSPPDPPADYDSH